MHSGCFLLSLIVFQYNGYEKLFFCYMHTVDFVRLYNG